MGNPNMIMSLAGNKADLSEQRAVPAEDAKASLLLALSRQVLLLANGHGQDPVNSEKMNECFGGEQMAWSSCSNLHAFVRSR